MKKNDHFVQKYVSFSANEIEKEFLEINQEKTKKNKEETKKALVTKASKIKKTDLTSNDRVDALRRAKVRELRDMGYDKREILIILKKGIIIDKEKINFENLNNSLINDDLDYLRIEHLSSDQELIEKKLEILSKYNFIYRKTLLLALSKEQSNKAPYFNIAKSILDKVSEIEGILEMRNEERRLDELTQPSKIAKELDSELTIEDKDAINAKINEILAKRDSKGD
jgi:hypothetical protein